MRDHFKKMPKLNLHLIGAMWLHLYLIQIQSLFALKKHDYLFLCFSQLILSEISFLQ